MRFVVVMMLAGAIGCSGTTEPTVTDGARPDASESSTAAAPAIPWLDDGRPPIDRATMGPCPAGWETLEEDDATICQPWEPGGRMVCEPHEAHFIGGAGCEPIGSPCPAGSFADGLPADGTVVYVLDGAGTGDGSRAAPHGTLPDALAGGLAPGTTVALGRGAYDAEVRLPTDARLIGACVEGTTLTTSARVGIGPEAPFGVVNAYGTGTEVRNLHVTAPGRAGIVAESSDPVDILADGVLVSDVLAAGIGAIDAAAVTARRAVVRDVALLRPAQTGGVSAFLGASLELTDSIVERAHVAGLRAAHGGSFAAERVVITETVSNASSFGDGVHLDFAATGSVRDAFVGRVSGSAAVVQTTGADLVTDGLVVRSTAANPFIVSDLGAVTVRRALVERNTRGGFGLETGASARVEDVVMRDTTAGTALAAVLARDSRVEAARVVSARHGMGGLVALRSDLFASDIVVVDGVLADDPDASVVGAMVSGEADGALARMFVDGGEFGVVLIDRTGEPLSVADVAVRNVSWHGLFHSEAENTSVRRLAVSDATRGGIVVGYTDRFPMEDVVVDGVSGDGDSSSAIELVAANVVIDRARLTRVVAVGVFSHGATTDLRNLVTDELLPCPISDCELADGYSAAFLARGGSNRLQGFNLGGGGLCGVHVADDAEVHLVDGVIEGHTIGACVQVDGYPLEQLTDEVEYRDNETNLQTTTLPLPEPSDRRL